MALGNANVGPVKHEKDTTEREVGAMPRMSMKLPASKRMVMRRSKSMVPANRKSSAPNRQVG